MKTVPMQRQRRHGDVFALSRALQELAPLSCTIVDERGAEPPLGPAGWVLRFTEAYRIRVIVPLPDADIKVVELVHPPDFVEASPALKELDGHGRTVYAIPIRVKFSWSILKRFGFDIRFNHLEVACRATSEASREDLTYCCPIVARPLWLPLLFAIVVGFGFVVLEHLAGSVMAGDKSLRELAQSFLDRSQLPLRLLILGAVALFIWIGYQVFFFAVLMLYQAPKRRRAFRERCIDPAL